MQYLEKIVRLVEKGRIKTKYSHHNLIYHRQNHFIFSVDCSGLVEFWLSKRAPLALAEIYDFVYRVRPVGKEQIKRLYSFDFYDYFCSIAEKGGQHWQVVDTMQILRQGDIIAFINQNRRGRFGHIAVVDKEIERNSERIVVRIIDSSTVEHIDDCRPSVKKGIGKGSIELHLTNGKITSVCYTPSCYKSRQVMIGRLK